MIHDISRATLLQNVRAYDRKVRADRSNPERDQIHQRLDQFTRDIEATPGKTLERIRDEAVGRFAGDYGHGCWFVGVGFGGAALGVVAALVVPGAFIPFALAAVAAGTVGKVGEAANNRKALHDAQFYKQLNTWEQKLAG